ncbi:MAG: hypothetical protein JWS11_303 [Cypionkella sp.]|nr:hypothetical protein [Cypionkella sp.]
MPTPHSPSDGVNLAPKDAHATPRLVTRRSPMQTSSFYLRAAHPTARYANSSFPALPRSTRVQWHDLPPNDARTLDHRHHAPPRWTPRC